MQYSPKLKKAMEQIKSIMNDNDIGGFVVLHSPGNSEYFTKVDPSYSCAKFEGDNLRVRAKLQEDFQGNKKAWHKKVTDTVNLFQHIEDVAGIHFINFSAVIKQLEKQIEIDSTKGGHSSHTTQNN